MYLWITSISDVFISLASLAGAGLCLYRYRKKVRWIDQILDNGIQTEGVMVDKTWEPIKFWDYFSEDGTFYPIIRFKTRKGELVIKELLFRTDAMCVGDAVTVVYDVKEPEQFIVKHKSLGSYPYNLYPYNLFIWFAFLLIIGLFSLFN